VSDLQGLAREDVPELRTIGVIVGTHGLDGTLKITPLSDFPERFDALDSVYLSREGERPRPDRVSRVRWSGGSVLITVKGVSDREAAREWRGAELCVREEETWKLPPDVYYVTDLLGFVAIGQDHQQIGVLRNVIRGAQDILEIEREGEESFLVPFVRQWIGRVDTDARTIEILNWRDLAAPEIAESDPDDD
jgi:16S rRNA processing protein RimM